MRLLSLLAGVLVVPVVYVAGRLSIGHAGGLLVAALLAASAPLVDHSVEARAYTLLVLTVLLSATGLIGWLVERERDGGGLPGRRRLALALFALGALSAFYTPITAVVWIWLALMIVGHQVQRRRGPGETRELLVTLGVMAALALPGLVRLARALTTPTNFNWLGQASPGLFMETVADILLPVSGGVPGASGVAMTVLVSAALALLTFRARHGLRRPIGRAPAVAAVVGALCALPLIIWLVGFAARPIFMPRTILVAAPGAVLLMAAIVHAQPERRWREALSVGLPGLFLASTLGGGLVRDKEDWRGAAGALARLAQPGDVLLVCAGYTYPAFRHAARSSLPLPVLLPGGDRPLLIERRFGGDPRWDSAVFRASTQPMVEVMETGTARVPLRPTAVALAAGSTAWLASSECDPGERTAIEAWLGGSAWRTLWTDPATPDRPGVRLMGQRITAARSVPAEALIPEARRAH